MCHKKNSDYGFLAGALIGGLVGAGVALLLAPDSGEKTRKKLKGKADELKVKAHLATKEARDKIDTAKEKFDDTVSDVKHKTQTIAKNITETVHKE